MFSKISGSLKPDEEPMNLTVHRQSVPSVIEAVEGDSSAKAAPQAADMKPVVTKIEPDDPRDPDSDLETDGAPMKIKSIDAIRKELPDDSKMADNFKDTVMSASLRQHAEPMVQEPTISSSSQTEVFTADKADEKCMEKFVLTCEDSVIDSVMNYASTGDHRYFISQFRHFLGVKDEHGDNSIHMAVINNQLKALNDMLVVCCATNTISAINQRNDKQQTPLHTAVILKYVAMVDLLLRHGADPSVTDVKGENCWHVAAKNKDVKTMGVLCQRHTQSRMLDAVNYKGFTPLILAVRSKAHDCVNKMLQAGADVNAGDWTSGRTPLHHAVQSGDYVIVSSLITTGNADVNAQAYNGNTPLHLAVSSSQHHMVKLLIDAGADVDIENWVAEEYNEDGNLIHVPGVTPTELSTGNDEITKLLTTSRQPNQSPTALINGLSTEKKRQIAHLLQDGGNDWMRLANRFGLNCLEGQLRQETAPALALLDYLSTTPKTIDELKTVLRLCGRLDCVEVIDKPGPNDSGHIHRSFDSGLGSIHHSGN